MKSDFPGIHHQLRSRDGIDGGRSFKRYFERLNLLRGWYDRETANAELSAHGGQPIPISQLLEEVTEELSDPGVSDMLLIEEAWPRVAGAALTKLVRPLRLENGILYLEVRHPALVRELTPSLDLYAAGLSKIVRAGAVTQIKLTASGGGTEWK